MEDYFNQPLDDLRKHSRIEPLDRDNLRSFPSTISEPLDRDNLRKIQFFNSGSGSSSSQVLLAGFRDGVTPYLAPLGCPLNSDPAVSPTHPSCKFFYYMKKNENVPSPDFLSERWDRIMDQWGQSMKYAYVLNSLLLILYLKV